MRTYSFAEGDFYAATFLFPREMAGLEATTEPFTEKSRLRFQYYEGTHGVQLKGGDSLDAFFLPREMAGFEATT